jgi:lactate dehydrogenase-like 2-hydroxyacid dehydrogenase
MGTAEFAAAKQGLRVVNVARGQLIDEEALITAMITGKVCGVGLDVHENEPVVDERLKNDPMVTILPHIGVCSQTCWGEFERRNWENIDGFFLSANKKPLTPVNVME